MGGGFPIKAFGNDKLVLTEAGEWAVHNVFTECLYKKYDLEDRLIQFIKDFTKVDIKVLPNAKNRFQSL
jgi:hypothetical protein